MKFKINQHVRILPFKENHINAYGRITKYYPLLKVYEVTNLNMPFQGTLNGVMFTENELEA